MHVLSKEIQRNIYIKDNKNYVANWVLKQQSVMNIYFLVAQFIDAIFFPIYPQCMSMFTEWKYIEDILG